MTPSVLSRYLLSLASVLASLCLLPARAHADADPASDILLTQSVFLPYAPPASANLKQAITTLTAETQRAGFPIKVAVVASATDLGGVSSLFGMPQRYSDFLTSEISFNQKQAVLVVMAAGIGSTNVAAAGTLRAITVDRAHGSDGLVRTAIAAIVKLSAASGHPVRTPKVGPAAGASSGVSPLVAFGAPVALVILAAGLAGLARRQRDSASDRDPEEHEGPETGGAAREDEARRGPPAGTDTSP